MSNVLAQHICHVFPSPSWGGAEIYAVQLATWQKAQGQTVSVWCLPGSRMAKEARERGLSVIDVEITERTPFVSLLGIVRTLKRHRVTQLHHHWAGGAWVFLGARLFLEVHEVVHLHLWISRAKKDLVHRALYRRIQAFIVAGERAAQAARALLPLRDEQIRILPYAMDLERFKSLPELDESLKLPSSGICIGLFARLDEQKGTLELLRAAETVMAQNPAISIIIMGDANVGDPGGYADRVRVSYSTHPFRDRIYFVPFRRDYLSVMRLCQLVVAPSYHESYSLVFLDAFALGIPVLTTDIGGSPDLVTSERGWLVPPRDAISLAKGILTALSSLASIKEKGRAAQEYVYEHHSPNAVLKQLEDIYAIRSRGS